MSVSLFVCIKFKLRIPILRAFIGAISFLKLAKPYIGNSDCPKPEPRMPTTPLSHTARAPNFKGRAATASQGCQIPNTPKFPKLLELYEKPLDLLPALARRDQAQGFRAKVCIGDAGL